MNETETIRLTQEELHKFNDQGYLGPFTMCSPEEMDVYRKQVDEVLATDNPLPTTNMQARHLDKKVVYDLCTHPAIIDRMAGILGEDLVLWRSNLWNKEPGGKEVPWHQDVNFWPIEPPINISAWLAIDEAVVENSCVQLIPGSHRKVVPHKKHDGTKSLGEEADPQYFDSSKAIPMELKPGQFFLFTERTLHYSTPNISNRRRLGLAVRVTVPFVKVYHEEMYEGHRNILIRGTDRFGLNQMTTPPTE
jgi:ectoine hydroxylase-related dioxygenase (phytanoyl-CoA dioxygenase family)